MIIKIALDELEILRAKRRKKGRITFDCLNGKVDGSRVVCSKGKRLGWSKDGSISLLLVLQGISLAVCKDCRRYDEETQVF